MSMIMYDQATTVINMHSAPRFGHSSNIALLASPSQGDRDDYIKGVQLFCFFNLFILFLWTVILIILKFMGPSRVGCAAGGEPLYVPVLRKQYDRATRKAIEKRSWRVQTAFFCSSIMIFILAGLFLYKGLNAIGQALQQVSDINMSIERVAMRASDITQSLQQERTRMHSVELNPLLSLETYCPNGNTATELQTLNMTLLGETVAVSLQEIDDFMDTYVQNAESGLTKVTNSTNTVNDAIQAFQANAWKPRLAIVVLVVINVFLLIGLILSRNNIVYNPYRCMEMYVLVPTFAVCLVLSALATYAFGAGAIMNADFCAGGEYPGSPEGTVEEIMMQQGVNPQDVVYQSFRYYVDGCRSENPLTFLEVYRPIIKSTMDAVNAFLSAAEVQGVDGLSDLCGADFDPVVTSVVLVKSCLQYIQTNIESALDLSTCYKVSPILRRMFNGPTCSDSVSALTWMFSCCFVISILGLIMLSVRAALYNATLRPKRKKMSKRRIKKEFKEYKEFMEQFYDNVHEWKLHPSPEKKEILRNDSFDTGITAMPSNDTDTGSADVENPLFDESDSFYSTPRARRLARSFVSCDESPEAPPRNALRDVTNEECQRLTPEAKTCMPRAPRKAFTSFQRTSLGMSFRQPPKQN